jgi:hypothetical protein
MKRIYGVLVALAMMAAGATLFTLAFPNIISSPTANDVLVPVEVVAFCLCILTLLRQKRTTPTKEKKLPDESVRTDET